MKCAGQLTPDLDDKDARRHPPNTLSLATKQLALVGTLDADAMLEGEEMASPIATAQ
jgi:hypothetical protein